MQIINTAHKKIFLDLVKTARKSIKLCAPFIKGKSTQWILDGMNCNVSLELITSITLGNFHQGASDISAIEAISQKNGTVYNVRRLHAKFYIFDDAHAIITSANLTPSGLAGNFEYGVYITEKTVIHQICGDYNDLLHNKNTLPISNIHIHKIKKILSGMPHHTSVRMPRLELYTNEDSTALIPKEFITQNMYITGWKRSVFDALCTIDMQTFTKHDYASLLPALQQQYPDNNHIEDKFRQILQQLRDIGLIQFEKDGVYTKLWA